MTAGKRPNILYLHSHDTGRYIQPYGYAVPTPNLQRFAEQAVVFRQAFNASPTCSPSRACLLTGQYAHSNGMLGLAHRGFALTDYSHHMLHTLRRAGYQSALAGVQHVAHGTAPWKIIGYDRHLGNHDVAHTAAAEFLAAPPHQPFFLSVGFFETHRAFPEPGSSESPAWCRPPAHLPDSPETRRDMAAYLASARTLDAKMGFVLDALERSGLAANTLVICTTDHGVAFPRMKCTLTDAGTGVMLMLRGPGGFAGGHVCDALVSHVDVFPTLCDLLGIAPPDWLQGVSLMPLVNGTATTVRDEVFAEVNFHAAAEPMRAVRTTRWKYIRRYDDRTRPVLPNCDDGLSKTFLLAQDWAERALDAEALYDLAFDPLEMANLAARPEAAATLEDMRGRLRRWMEATADPLLDGKIEAPATAKLNDPDGLSPNEKIR